jgi:hypothetical protein
MDEVKLQRTYSPISSLVDAVDRGQLRLPEIQRDYVWKPAQVAGLLDSLYKEYPSGSILLWETDQVITERRAKIEPTGAPPVGAKVQFLLDGQQRLTSLHRVLHDPANTRVVFNVEDERFQIESAATANDSRWVTVHEILVHPDLFAFVDHLADRNPGVARRDIGRRVERVRRITAYVYHVEVISNLSYEDVTKIFIRVNSQGRALKTTDLALATLSARWPGVMGELEDERDHWQSLGWPAIDLAFLARSIAALGTESRMLSGFKDASLESLQTAWLQTKDGIRHLVEMLDKNLGIETSTLIPSSNALVPLVAYLGARDDSKPLAIEEADALMYWLLGAFLTGRFSQSGDTRIAEDAKAIRSADPLENLYRNLGLFGGRLEVTEQSLQGKGARSPYFLLAYLVSRVAGATDWWYALRIGLDATGSKAIEYHHIHPQATLKKDYGKAEINDLANLAFISSRANKRISDRSPAAYFKELDPSRELAPHFVPLGEEFRLASAYPDFIRARRALLADAMTAFVERFRPRFMGSVPALSAAGARRLVVTLVEPTDGESRSLEFWAQVDGQEWTGEMRLADLYRCLADIEDGLTASLDIDGESVTIPPGADLIELPIGPFLVVGSLQDWRDMIDRELADIVPATGRTVAHEPWVGERIGLPVGESE